MLLEFHELDLSLMEGVLVIPVIVIARVGHGSRRLIALERQRNALAAADAQRDDAALEAVALHRMQQPRGQHRAGGADRVAVRDGAALDVDDVLGEAELAACTASAIAAKASLISTRSTSPMRPAGALQRLAHRRHRAEAEQAGLDRADAIGHQPRHRLQAVLLGPLRARRRSSPPRRC